uniref:Uncharacterized protein n=1 Tax=Davidia involucrata TaxID=16924 RepID=A0A5B7BUA1_DAVIN
MCKRVLKNWARVHTGFWGEGTVVGGAVVLGADCGSRWWAVGGGRKWWLQFRVDDGLRWYCWVKMLKVVGDSVVLRWWRWRFTVDFGGGAGGGVWWCKAVYGLSFFFSCLC